MSTQLEVQRKIRGWSGAELARRANLHPSTISTIEHRRLVPYPSQLEKLAVALGWEGSPEALLEEVGGNR